MISGSNTNVGGHFNSDLIESSIMGDWHNGSDFNKDKHYFYNNVATEA